MGVNNGWWWALGAAAALGGVAGGWLAFELARLRHGRALKRATENLQKQNATLTEQLRSSQARTQIELEQLRQSHKRQRAPAQGRPDATAAQAEQRLVAAYDELDRLRRQVAGEGPQSVSPELTDGFAATRPMHDRM